MNRLIDISKQLSGIAFDRLRLRTALDELAKTMAAYEVEIVPEGGWTGKNADERKINEALTKALDPNWATFLNQKAEKEYELGELEAVRESLVAEKDAITWTIRDHEQAAISGQSVLEQLEDIFAMQEAEYQESLKTQIEQDPHPEGDYPIGTLVGPEDGNTPEINAPVNDDLGW